MRPDLQSLMDKATALTRGGHLREATELIQRSLLGAAAANSPVAGDVIQYW
ncbi:MAG: hypothetical protein NVS2B4_10740 [Ramlibacter sp.]